VPSSSTLLFLAVTRQAISNLSAVVGNYAVDPRAGDVFSATSACLRSTALGESDGSL